MLLHDLFQPDKHMDKPYDKLVEKLKGAQTYCIINERDQPAAKECNRKLYYRQNSKNFCVRPRMGLWLYWTILIHMFQKVAEDF